MRHLRSARAADRNQERFSSNTSQILLTLEGVDVDTHPEMTAKQPSVARDTLIRIRLPNKATLVVGSLILGRSS